MGRIAGEADPAALGVGRVGLAEAGRGAHGAVLPLRAFLVAAAVERREQAAGDLGRFLEDGVGGVGVDPLGQSRQALPQGGGVEHVVEQEAHVAQRGVVFRHFTPRR